MSEYPAEIDTFRVKENRQLVVYDPTKTRNLFVEDFEALETAIVAIETVLGIEPAGGLADVGARFANLMSVLLKIDQTTKQTIINNIPKMSGAGNQYLELISTDHAAVGIKLIRADDGSDIYTDMYIYNQTSHTKIDQKVGGVQTNLLDLMAGLLTINGGYAGKAYGGNGVSYKALAAGGSETTPTATQNGQYMLFFGASGYVTAFLTTAQGLFGIKANQLFTATAQGTVATIETTKNGTTSRLIRVFVGDDGGVKIGDSAPAANLALDVPSTTKAFKPPCMTTTQRDAIATPTEGMIIFNLTTHKINYHNGTAWTAVA